MVSFSAGERLRYHHLMDPRSNVLMRSLPLALLLLVCAPVVAHGSSSCEPSVVYLVRHAEKADAASSENPNDPHLSEEGVERAGELVRLLGDAEITGIYSTNYRRTIETVEPLAKSAGLEIGIYDPGDPAAIVSALKGQPGRYVVTGHSNTIPGLVKLLGGDPGLPIEEAGEYDRLYILVIEGEQTTTIRLRYGMPSHVTE